MFRAVLFDLDGTLIDGFPAIAASVNHVRSLHGLPPLSIAEVTRQVGRGPAYLLAHTVGAGEPQANLAAYWTHHPTVIRETTVLLPGVRETLKALVSRGVKLGVCSNKPITFTRDIIEHLGIAPLLAVVLGPEDAGRHKPAPDMILLAMRRLGVDPEQTLFVGDMVVDVETARNAGVAVWVVPTGSQTEQELRAARPDRLIQGLDELVSGQSGASGPGVPGAEE